MKTTKHPTELTEAEAAAVVEAFDDAPVDAVSISSGRETLPGSA